MHQRGDGLYRFIPFPGMRRAIFCWLLDQVRSELVQARPLEIVLVRHGETEANVALERSRRGDNSLITEAFRQQPTDFVRLTPTGIIQAQSAGEWLKRNVPSAFDQGYVSFFPRTWETAGHLGLHDATWRQDVRLNERSWGDLDILTESEREDRFADSLRRKSIDPLGWNPPNGETMYHIMNHCWMFLQTLYREFPGKRIIIVCHGETIWAFRIIFERIDAVRYRQMCLERIEKERVHNCQIIRYLRVNPETGESSQLFGWKQSICPWDLSLSPNAIEPIVRREFANADLLKMVEHFPRLMQ